MASIHRVLVANRGEIAVRVIRACHEEGMAAVAVYSEPDRLAPHVRDADAAMLLGPAPAAESYLDIRKLIAAAKDTGCQAVHPGYGFLSERAAFAEACKDAGLIFVGPPATAIRAMGDKTEARRRKQAARVPVGPGTTTPSLGGRHGGGRRGRVRERRDHRVPAHADRRVLLPRDEHADSSRAPRDGARVRRRPGARAASDCRGTTDARARRIRTRWSTASTRSRDRMPHHRRGSVQ